MFKIILILFFCIGIYVNVLADCANSGLYFWPNSPNISQNTIFVVEGYAQSQIIIQELNKKHPIYLKSKKKKIKLEVKEILVGEFYLTQAILIPLEKLEIGLEYELFIDGFAEDNQMIKQWNNLTKTYTKVKWKVINEVDNEAPKWIQKPKEIKKSVTQFGCGPAEYVIFSFQASDRSEYLIKTTRLNIKTKKQTTYYLKHSNGNLKIGHGMCSGEFTFLDLDDYELRIELVDSSGNITQWDEKPIFFTSPTK